MCSPYLVDCQSRTLNNPEINKCSSQYHKLKERNEETNKQLLDCQLGMRYEFEKNVRPSADTATATVVVGVTACGRR